MKMFKNALLLGGVMATFALTSCLKGGNSASYTAIGTVATDKVGQTVFMPIMLVVFTVQIMISLTDL